jgi:hypothetical protein
MDFNAKYVMISMSTQLLNISFELGLLQGRSRTEAAERSHRQAMEFLREAGSGESELTSMIIPEDAWVRTMLVGYPEEMEEYKDRES